MDTYDPAIAGRAFTATAWQRSPLCGPDQGDCVEVNTAKPGVVAIRDTKLANSPVLVFTTTEWETFTAAVQQGAFKQP